METALPRNGEHGQAGAAVAPTEMSQSMDAPSAVGEPSDVGEPSAVGAPSTPGVPSSTAKTKTMVAAAAAAMACRSVVTWVLHTPPF